MEEEKVELSNKISELSVALQHLKSEKERMELEFRNKEIEELKSAKELEKGLESAEVDKRQEQESQKHKVEQLEKEVKEEAERRTKQLDDLQDQLQACRQRELYLEGKRIETEADNESMKALLAEMETDKNHLQTLVEELQTGRDSLCAQAEAWKRERENLKIDINTLQEETNNLKIKAKAEVRENPKTALLPEKDNVQCSPVSPLVGTQVLLSVVEKEKSNTSAITSSLEQENQNVEEKEKLAGDQGQQQSTGASVQKEFEMCKLSVAKLNEQVHALIPCM